MAAIEIMTEQTLARMREACQLAAETLVEVGKRIEPGVTTGELDAFVHEFTVKAGAWPSPLNYHGFPKSCCTSINEVVCHGIPSKRALKEGDIINVDITSYFPAKDGFHGDTSATFYVGRPSEEAKRVTEISRRCLEIGIAQVRDGARIGDIGAAIQQHAQAQGVSVVRDYVGHGIGREFHTAPQVPHYGKPGTGKRLKAGMVFTIEPMINIGTHECELLEDGWTVVTRDRQLSAQFEHTLTVTHEGCEVLTARRELLHNSEMLPWVELGPLSAPAGFAPAASEAAGHAG